MAKGKGGKGKGGKKPPPLPSTLAVGSPLDQKSSFSILQKSLMPKAPKKSKSPKKHRAAPPPPPPPPVFHRPAPGPPVQRPPPLTTLPTVVMRAAERGDIAYVLTWIAAVGSVDATWNSPDTSVRGFTLLMCACDYAHEDLVDALLRKGAAPNLQDSHGYTALMLAAAKGSHKIVKRLLRGGARTDIRHIKLGSAIEFAETKDFPLVTQLIRAHEAMAAGAPTLKLPTEVATSAAAGDSSAVLAWLDCGGRVDAVDGRKATLLMIASENGFEPLVDALLSRGASADLRRDDGATALTIGAMSGRREVVRRLIVQRGHVSGHPPKALPGPDTSKPPASLEIPESAMEFRLSERWRIS